MSSLKKYVVIVMDRESKQDYKYEFENLEVSVHDLGIGIDKFGKLVDNQQHRIEIRAWSGCERFEDFKSLFNQEIK